MINYFISSPFNDIHNERDIIFKKISPIIKAYGNQYGQNVYFADLRWGINTVGIPTGLEINKVLSVCMSEIDMCHPNVIIILGDRYGSIPGEEAIKSLLASRHGEVFMRDDLEGKSVTELEIIHALKHKNKKESATFAIICFRNSLSREQIPAKFHRQYFCVNTEDEKRLHNLKQWLIKNFPENIIYYDAVWNEQNNNLDIGESFFRKLTDRLINNVQKEYSASLTELNPEQIQFNCDISFRDRQVAIFNSDPYCFTQINEFLDSPSASVLFIRGKSGMGKSSLISKIYFDAENNEKKVVCLFCGNGRVIFDVPQLMNNLIYQLKRLDSLKGAEIEQEGFFYDQKLIVRMLIERITESSPLYIMIDALNVLRDDEHLRTFDFLPFELLPERSDGRLKFILSMTEELDIPLYFFNQPYVKHITITTPDEKEMPHIARNHLKYVRHELPDDVLEEVYNKSAGHTPLYIALLLHRINMLVRKDYDAVSKKSADTRSDMALYSYIRQIIDKAALTEEELAVEIALVSGDMLGFPYVIELMCVLSLFRSGINMTELVNILVLAGNNLSYLDVSVYVRFLDSLLIWDWDKRIIFSHDRIREGMRSLCISIKDEYEQVVFRYLDSLPVEDPLRKDEYLRFSVLCKKYGKAAEHLARTFITCLNKSKDNLEQSQDNPRTTDFYAPCDELARQLLDIYLKAGESDRATENILSIISASKSSGTEVCYGVCCLFLFSYDIFFTARVSKDHISKIMHYLYDAVTYVLYPKRAENPDYLRTVYVCCEQLASRTDDMFERDNFTKLFVKYCHEYSERNDLEEYEKLENIHDLAIAYKKCGMDILNGGWRSAIKWFEAARHTISTPIYLEKKKHTAESFLYDLLLSEMRKALAEASEDKFIGFPVSSNLASYIDRRLPEMVKALDYYLEKKNYSFAMMCCELLLQYYTYIDDPKKELEYALLMKEYAKEVLKKSNDILANDYIRNVEFRLGYDDVFGYSIEQRLYHFENAFKLAVKNLQIQDSTVSRRILYNSIIELLKLRCKYVEQLRGDEYTIPTDRVFEQCMKMIEELVPWLYIMSEGDDSDKTNNVLSVFVICIAHEAHMYRDIAIKSYNGKYFRDAGKNGDRALKLFYPLRNFISDKAWIENMLDICEIAATSYYMCYSVESFPEAKSALRGKDHAISNLFALVIEYRSRFGISRRTEDLWNRFIGINKHLLTDAWLLFAANNVEKDEDIFWRAIKREKYYLRETSERWLFLLGESAYSNEYRNALNVVGGWLCKQPITPKIDKLNYLVNCFEFTALYYAASHAMSEVQEHLIRNGYDRYLELPSLYILYRYDKRSYRHYMYDIKYICLKRLIKRLSGWGISEITGERFIAETKKIAREILRQRDCTNKDDPKEEQNRTIYKYRYDDE